MGRVVQGYFCGKMYDEVPALSGLPAEAAEEIVLNAALNSKVRARLAAPAGRAVRQPRLQRLHAAAERGAHLSHQLLTLARADGAALERGAHGSRVDLARLVTDAAADWVRPALAAGQDLGYALQPAPVLGEAWLLRELVANLVHNAQQHAGPGAQVTVRTGVEGALAVLEVQDDGPGMDAADRARAWDRFHRGRAARAPAPDWACPSCSTSPRCTAATRNCTRGPWAAACACA